MGLFTKLFGGKRAQSQETSESSNRAWDPVSTAFSPMLGYANEGAGGMSSFLKGDFSGFDKFKEGTGFDFNMNRGLGAIDSAAANKRMVHSGAAAKSLQEFGNNIQNTYADKYLGSLGELSKLGIGSAGSLIGAGQTSKSQGTSKSSEDTGNFGQMIGTMLSFLSDPRVKEDIKYIRTLDNGLGVYSFNYVTGDGPFVGVMADEVERIQPEALGPEINGFKTVNYALIEGL